MANILIVDDSRTSRKILRGLLEANGYVVVGEAKNGQEGYDMYAQYKPDLVTMDITMPVMSGVDSLKKIKADFPDAKVVMVSAAHRDAGTQPGRWLCRDPSCIKTGILLCNAF